MSVELDAKSGKLPLFARPEIQEVASVVLNKIEGELTSRGSGERTAIDFMKRFVFLALRDFQVRSEEYDRECQYNKSVFHSRFIDFLLNYDGGDSKLASLFCVCYRFVCEFEVVSPTDLSGSVSSAKMNLVGVDFEEYQEAKEQYLWANSQMLVQILRRFFNNPDVRGFSSFSENIKVAKSEIERFDAAYIKKVERISELEQRLQRSEQGYNFANLNEGFSRLKISKIREKNVTLILLWFSGLALLSGPLFKIFGLLPERLGEYALVVDFLVILGFELLLIYYFRIFLHNFRSLKLQILQVDLRMTLCSFIESYSDFAVKTRKDDKEVLLKFEQIIFSEVSSGDTAIPSVFDGIEHVSSVFGKIKAK
ncbi:hypothetical protein WIN67_17895 [Pseudomonas idahonensis]|uniref:hypothetical protein n=1 Tax=Pseudomonas idahonensis TaxID=2942628 RepID=UPI0030CC373D